MSQRNRFARHLQPLERGLRWLVCLALIVGWLLPAAALARDPDATALPVRPVTTSPVTTEEPAATQAPQAPAAVGIVVTKDDRVVVDPDSDGKADVGDTIRYTIGITNSGSTDATGVGFSDTIDSLTTLVGGSVRVTPLAGDDSFAAIGNTMLYVGVAKLVNTPAKEIAGNLFANDTEFLGDTFTLQGFSAASVNGGAVSVNANGSFIYLPPTGFTGTDSFTYTIVDSGGLTSQATVTITVAERVWYVDSNAFPGGTGRSNTPFTTMAAAQSASGANDYIFVNTGSGNYGGITLKNGQQLIGRSVDLIVSGFTLLTAGTAPTLSAAGTLVTLAQNNTVRGMNINSQAAGLGISGTNFGGAVINNVGMNGGPALTLATGTLTASLSLLTSAGGATGVSLTGVNGSLSVTAGSMSNISGTDFLVSGGNIAVTYPGAITNTAGRSILIESHNTGAITFSGAINDTGIGLLVQNNSGGTITFSNAAKTFSTGANTAITLSSNTGATILFTGGGLSVSTTTAVGIDVSGGGTLEISGTGNTVATTGNTAFSMVNTTIHANDITFQSISANGGGSAKGLVLNTTGSEAFTVTGTGATDGTGGTIQNTTRGAEFTSASNVTLKNMNFTSAATDGATNCDPTTNSGCNGAITLSGGSAFLLDNLNFTGTMQYGVNATGSSNITLQNSNLTGCGNESDEGCVRWHNLGGTSTISGSSIINSAARNIWIYNTSGTYTLNVTSVTLDNTIASANGASNMLVYLLGSSVATVNVSSSTITRHKTDGIYVVANDSSVANVKVQTSTIGTVADDGIGVNLGATIAGQINFNIINNPAIYGKGNGASPVIVGAFDNAVIQGRINNNSRLEQLGATATQTIRIIMDNNSRGTFEIQSNTIINNGGGNPIAIDKPAAATNRVDATIVGNTITNAPTTSAGIRLRALENNTICGDVRSNTVNNVNVGAGSFAFTVRASLSTSRIELEGFNSSVATTWGTNGNNPNDPNAVTFGGSGFIGAPLAGTCASPTNPTGPEPVAKADPTDTEQAAPADAASAPSNSAEAPAESTEPAGSDASQINSEAQAAAQASSAALPPRVPASGENVAVTVGTLPAGKSITIFFDVTLGGPIPAAKEFVSNQASVSGSNFTTVLSNDPATPAASDPTLTPIDAAPNLGVSKTDGGISTTPGATVAYTLNYTNTGTQEAAGVVLSETVPANASFNAGASSPGWVCAPNNNAGSTCTLPVGGLAINASGTATFAVTVANPVAAGVSQISNTATIADNGLSGPDLVPANNTASDTTPVDAQPDLAITKSDGGASVAPGGTVAYTLNYSNVGNQGASGVVLSETVPANASFNAGASTAGWVCAPNNNAGSTCTLAVGGVNGGGAGGTATFAVTVINPVAAGVTQISNTATVADNGANGVDPNTANNSGSDTTPLNATPDLTITKSDGGASVAPGGTVAYTLSYNNVGNQGATGIVLTETVPGFTTFNAGASTAGWVCAPNNNPGSTCTLNVGGVAAGTGGTATFALTVVTPAPSGVSQISNTASVADDGSNGADPTPANNSSTDTTPLDAAPDLTLTKSDGGASVAPGGTVAYTLNITNAGNQGATGIVLSETVPANTTFNPAASSPGWVCAPNNNAGSSCTLTVGNLAGNGASSPRTFAVTVINPAAAGVSQISNSASVANDGSNGADPTPANNTASDTTPLTAAPDLRLTKSDGGISAGPLDVIAYTLSITNTGNQGATGVVLTETVPLATTFNAGASSAGWACLPNTNAGSTCTLTVGSLAGGGAATSRIFAVTVVDPLPGGVTQTTNTATVGDDGANGADATPANNTGSDTTPLSAAPDLAITKSDGGTSVAPGGTVAYTLSFSNSGTRAASGVVITETVPLNTTFNAGASSPGWACTPNGNAGSTCTIGVGTVNGRGGNGTRIFAVTVVSPAPSGLSQISNTASIGDDGLGGPDANPADNSGSDTTPVNAAPDLTISKSDGAIAAAPGDTVAYTLSYANVGNQDASGVGLTETVPANTTFNAGASTAGWVCAPNGNAGSTCTLTIGNLNSGANGTATFAVTVANPVAAGVEQISNTATIADNGANGADPTPGNNSGSDTTPLTAAPDLTITKSDGGASVAPGGTVAYTLSYANAGNQNATGVVLSETVPANTTFNAGASTAGWVCAPNGNAGSTCTISIGSLAGGINGTRVFAVTVVNPAAAGVNQISNTASIADDGANGADPTPGNNSGSDTTPLNAAPVLSLTKSDGGASVAPGGTVVYTLVYSNTGNQVASGVRITETVPLNTTFNAGSSAAGWTCLPNNNAGSTCTLNIGNLPVGASAARAFAVTVVNPVAAGVEQISNTATIADDGTNSAAPATATASDTTPVTAAPDLIITKSDGGVSTAPGQTVIYTLNITNTGNQNASAVVLTETVPANTTYAGGGWTCLPNTNAGSTCTRALGGMAGGGGNSSVTFAVTVVNPVASGVTQISNTATVADDGSSGADPTPANNTASDTTPVTAAPVLTLTKSDGGVSVAPGGTVAYTLSITNTGNQAASGVVLTETVPLNTTFNAGASTAGWACAPNGNAGATCTLSVGGVTTTASAVFAVTVDSPVAAGVTQISNSASVADDGSNGPLASAAASDTTPLNITLDLRISKTVQPAVAQSGDQIVYTIRFTSTGNTIATGIRITDTLPAQVTIATIESSGVALTQTANTPPTLAWLADPMAPGATGIITLTGTVNAGINSEQSVINTVTIAHPQETAPASNTATATFTINLPPIANAAGPYSVNEGSTVVLSGAASNDPGGDSLSYAWDLDNNGSYETAGITVTFTNTADDGVFTVGLRVTDSDGAVGTTSATVTVLNVAPSVNAGADRTTTPNQTLTFGGSFTDPGVLDTHTIAWNFGDGQSTTGTLSPTHAFSLPGTYTVTLTVTDDDGGVGTDTLRVVVANNRVYLPLIMRSPPAPDLVVQSISTTATSISVVIKNQGAGPVTEAFWVDLYLNPNPAPTAVNQIWQTLAPYGMVWGVTQAALPLQPGQSLTLTSRGLYFRNDLSSFPSTIASGTNIYVQVDSANSDTTYGAILESHEQAGQPYNNIRGPQTTTQPIVISPAPDADGQPDAALPKRPDSASR